MKKRLKRGSDRLRGQHEPSRENRVRGKAKAIYSLITYDPQMTMTLYEWQHFYPILPKREKEWNEKTKSRKEKTFKCFQ